MYGSWTRHRSRGLLDWGPYQFRGLYHAWNCGVLWNSCDGSLYCNNCRFAVLVFKKRAEAEEPAWYDDGIWLCDGSGNSVSVITAGEHWGIRVRSGSLVSVLRIWTKWPDGFSSIDGNFAEYLPASECNS